MITMEKSGQFFNPSRASPLDLVVRDSNRGQREAFIAKNPQSQSVQDTVPIRTWLKEKPINISPFFSMAKSGKDIAAS